MSVLDRIASKKRRNVAYVAGGMTGLLAGSKLGALALFGKGLWGLEQVWREDRGFCGTWSERWQEAAGFYQRTHQNPINRALHIAGIPLIAGGAAGMLAFPRFRPLWALSASSYSAGWVLNLVGHAVFEKNAPAFADDPLSFFVGPVWDLQQLSGRQTPSAVTSSTETVTHAAGVPVQTA
ncbi:MAG: DUF962 domain-containing protein [Planctomycetota bacterium]